MLDATVATGKDAAHGVLVVELVECFTLHTITEHAACVALLVVPGDRIDDLERTDGLVFGEHLGRCGELNAHVLCELRQGAEEVEDVAAERLIVAESGELHHDAHHVLALGQRCNPTEPLVGHERVFRPGSVVEAKSDVVRKLVVAQDEREARVLSAGIDVVRALPTEDVLSALDHHALEAHVGHQGSDLVVVDERAVAEHLRALSEYLFNLLCLTFCLGDEVVDVAKRREAVAVWLSKELDASRCCQAPEEVEHFGGILLDELQRDAADAEGHFEGFAVLCNHVEHCLQGRLVAFLEEFVDDAFVLVVVVVVVVGADVEETIAFEVYGLVYLEV